MTEAEEPSGAHDGLPSMGDVENMYVKIMQEPMPSGSGSIESLIDTMFAKVLEAKALPEAAAAGLIKSQTPEKKWTLVKQAGSEVTQHKWNDEGETSFLEEMGASGRTGRLVSLHALAKLHVQIATGDRAYIEVILYRGRRPHSIEAERRKVLETTCQESARLQRNCTDRPLNVRKPHPDVSRNTAHLGILSEQKSTPRSTARRTRPHTRASTVPRPSSAHRDSSRQAACACS